METANGLNIDERGTVEAIIEERDETEEIRWGKIDDPEAGDIQGTLGIEDATWKERREEDGTIFFVYEKDGDTLMIAKDEINQLPV